MQAMGDVNWPIVIVGVIGRSALVVEEERVRDIEKA